MTQVQKMGFSAFMANPNYKKRFDEILGKKAQGFISSVINTVGNNPGLQKCDSNSILMAAVVAATLDLPVDKNLGFAWIIPYGNRASFQLGYKGYIQLAQRSGYYQTIHTDVVREGEFVSKNKLTGEIEFNWEGKTSDKVMGYTAFFKLSNGFEKAIFWTVDEVEAHAKRYSQAYKANKKDSPWFTDYDLMAMKTILKHILSKWGILSIEMQSAVRYDQGIVIDPDKDQVEYPDGAIIEDAEEVEDLGKDESADDQIKPGKLL